MYAIVDIETTGNGIKGNKITEISIFKYDGYEIIDEFTSLVNPECEIPYFITGLTGIDNDLVRNAPKLHEITDKIDSITKDTIFVAHSVGFDYNVIKNEYNSLGLDFTRKKLCTVRLARKLIPGYNSYSLGKICSSLNIPLKDRHRARGDAHATTLLFQKLLRTTGAEEVFKSFLNARSQETTLPPGLPKSTYKNLPTSPGVYYFKNQKGKIIYIGKAINIKKRVLSHFYDKATKEIELCNETTDIDYELSGSELIALLMESAAIKLHFPKFNKAQKRTVQRYGIFTYEDRKGIMHLAFNKIKLAPNPIIIFYNTTDCRLFLEALCNSHALCAKYCHLQENIEECSHFRVKECKGICRGTETITTYNSKVKKAISHIKENHKNFIIKVKGRAYNEIGFVQVKEGLYTGYGFVEKDIQINVVEDLEPYLIPQKSTLETERVIKTFITRNPDKLI